MCRSFVLPTLIAVFLAGPAVAFTDNAQNPATSQQQSQKSQLNRMELAMHALAATCIRHPKGLGLAEAVAPGQPFSLPPLTEPDTWRLASVQGAKGWILPRALGDAALILRPDGSCSILIREIVANKADRTLKTIFSRLENLRLKHLESKVCLVAGVSTTTQTYTMIPTNAQGIWSQPEIQYDESGTARLQIWRGFLLAVAARQNRNDKNDKNTRYNMVMTTYVGHHVIGQSCRPEQEL